MYFGSLHTKFRLENIYLAKQILSFFITSFQQNLSHKELIHIAGDSHVFSFTNPLFRIHYLGPATAYGLKNVNSKTESRERLIRIAQSLSKGSTLILVFGEIDSRIQIFNQYMKQRKKINLVSLISQTVDRYTSVVKEISQLPIRIFIFNVLPPGEQSNIYNYPFYADRKTRLYITREFNRQLKFWCERDNIVFIDIFNSLINSDNTRIKDLVLDKVHYNNKIVPFVLKQLGKIGGQVDL